MKRAYRFYINQSLEVGHEYQLDKPLFHRLVNVVRFKKGAQFFLFNFDGHEYQTTFLNPKTAKVLIEAKKFQPTRPITSVGVVASIIKNEKMDIVIQKAVELGASSIWPIFSQNSDQKKLISEKKHKHWKKIATQATEQCSRNDRVTIHPVQTLEDYLSTTTEAVKKIIFAPQTVQSIRSASLKLNCPIDLLVWPEGGWSAQEMDAFNQMNCSVVNLGSRILRAETAVMAGLVLVQGQLADQLHLSIRGNNDTQLDQDHQHLMLDPDQGVQTQHLSIL